MFEEALSLLSIWASMNSWLTPTVLFLLLNLMIGTIAVTSGFTSSKPPPSHHHHHHHPDHLHLHLHHQPQLQTQLTRSSSVLQRLKSLNFYSYIHTAPQPSIQIHHPTPPSTSTITATATTFTEPTPEPISHSSPPAEQKEEAEAVEVSDEEGPTMDEIYSQIIQKQNNPHHNRQNSDTKPAAGEIPVKLPSKMKKSASDKSAFNHFEAVDEASKMETFAVEQRENVAAKATGNGGTEVDARADDFINKFREQLKMQRMESIVKYKEMITRGTAK